MTTADAAPDREPRSRVIARRTRGLIAELQLEQRELAGALGMSQPNMSRKVNGRIAFTPDEVEALAPLLGVREDYLYGFTNDRGPRPTESTGGLDVVRQQGLEPRTRWLSACPPLARTFPPMPMPMPGPDVEDQPAAIASVTWIGRAS